MTHFLDLNTTARGDLRSIIDQAIAIGSAARLVRQLSVAIAEHHRRAEAQRLGGAARFVLARGGQLCARFQLRDARPGIAAGRIDQPYVGFGAGEGGERGGHRQLVVRMRENHHHRARIAGQLRQRRAGEQQGGHACKKRLGHCDSPRFHSRAKPCLSRFAMSSAHAKRPARPEEHAGLEVPLEREGPPSGNAGQLGAHRPGGEFGRRGS